MRISIIVIQSNENGCRKSLFIFLLLRLNYRFSTRIKQFSNYLDLQERLMSLSNLLWLTTTTVVSKFEFGLHPERFFPFHMLNVFFIY